jgi:hypothetical protein
MLLFSGIIAYTAWTIRRSRRQYCDIQCGELLRYFHMLKSICPWSRASHP